MSKTDSKKPSTDQSNKAEKKTVEKKAKAVKLDHAKFYNFEANGKAPTLKKGTKHRVNGYKAEILLKGGYGKIID